MHEIYKINIDFLSPVHIGSGEEIEPFSYKVEGNYFHKINLESFLFNLEDSDRPAFDKIINKLDLLGLRKFIAEKCDINKYGVYKALADKKFQEKYAQSFENLNNELLVYSFIRSSDYKPYIPGSTLKGAIRTALLNYFINKDFTKQGKSIENIIEKEYYEKKDKRGKDIKVGGADIEGFVLGHGKDAKKDPFRGLLVTDASLKNRDYIYIEQVINFNPEKSSNSADKLNSFQMFYEVTPSFFVKEEDVKEKFTEENVVEDYTADGEMRIDKDLFSKDFFTKKISVKDIIEACNTFYLKIAEYEFNKFYRDQEGEEFIKLNKNLKNLSNNQFLLRIGRFIHKESMTFEGFENIKRKNDNQGGGTTRNLLAGKYPMGWVKVTID